MDAARTADAMNDKIPHTPLMRQCVPPCRTDARDTSSSSVSRARSLAPAVGPSPRSIRANVTDTWSCGAASSSKRGQASGTVYGLVVWLGFELGIAPALGLSQAKRVRVVDRLALAADHLLYGLVLSGTRRNARG